MSLWKNRAESTDSSHLNLDLKPQTYCYRERGCGSHDSQDCGFLKSRCIQCSPWLGYHKIQKYLKAKREIKLNLERHPCSRKKSSASLKHIPYLSMYLSLLSYNHMTQHLSVLNMGHVPFSIPPTPMFTLLGKSFLRMELLMAT